MSEDQRVEWIKVARATLGHLPADLLAIGCAEARKVADHPAKIVPAIMRMVEPMLDRRKRIHAEPIPVERRIGKGCITPAEALRAAEQMKDAPAWFREAFGAKP